jgi:hypothetical protein
MVHSKSSMKRLVSGVAGARRYALGKPSPSKASFPKQVLLLFPICLTCCKQSTEET